MILLAFLIKAIFISGVLYAYYFFFLRNKQFHQYNRYYLLLSLALSIILPFVKIPIFIEATGSQNIVYHTLNVITVDGFEEPTSFSAR
jgi:hypothetical protein